MLSGALGSLLCAGVALVVPEFMTLYEETGTSLPTSTEVLVGVPAWAWWVLSVLSIALMLLKDRWLEGWRRDWVNDLFGTAALVAGPCVVVCLLLALTAGEKL